MEKHTVSGVEPDKRAILEKIQLAALLKLVDADALNVRVLLTEKRKRKVRRR
jgi:hypothetical protein